MKRFLAHLGNLQAAFQGTLEMIQHFREVENGRRAGRLQLKLVRVFVRGFFVKHRATPIHRDRNVFRIRSGKYFREDDPWSIRRHRDRRRHRQQYDFFHRATFSTRADRTLARADEVAWQMATARASEASSDAIASSIPVSERTMSFT